MKFYIATNLANSERAKALAGLLTTAGHELTYDWMVHGSLIATPQRWPAAAEHELAGVLASDFVIVLLPGGRGTHVEMGAALATGKRVFLVASPEDLDNPYPCVFHRHHLVRRLCADSTDTAIAWMIGNAMILLRHRPTT